MRSKTFRKILNPNDKFNDLHSKIKDNKITQLTLSTWGRSGLCPSNHYWVCLPFRWYEFNNYEDQSFLANIFLAIKNNTSLKLLRLDGIRFNRKAYHIFNALCKMLKENEHLESIEFNDSCFSHGSGWSSSQWSVENFRINLSRFFYALSSKTSINTIKFEDRTFVKNPMDKDGYFTTKQLCHFFVKRNKHTILKLNFNSKVIHFDTVIRFAIDNNIHFEKLELSNSYNKSIPASSIIALIMYLNHNFSTKLSLKGHIFHIPGDPNLYELLLENIFKNNSLKTISIQNINENVFNRFENCNAINYTLEQLNLYDCQFSKEFFAKLTAIIKNSIFLTKLSLNTRKCIRGFWHSKNINESNGFKALLDVIAKHPTLRVLEMQGQYFNRARLCQLHEMVSHRIRPLTLDLSGLNSFWESDFDILQSIISHPNIEAFIYSPRIRPVFIFKTKHLDPIIQCIKLNPSLHTLDLRDNEICNEGAILIANAISNNLLSSIQTVMLDGNDIDDAHLEQINAAIKKMKNNMTKSLHPFQAFSSLSNDNSNPFYLPAEITEYIISLGLFSTLSPERENTKIYQLTNEIMGQAEERRIRSALSKSIR